MITLRPLPCEKRPIAKLRKIGLPSFTVQAISDTKLDPDQMAWVADKVAQMVGNKQGNLTGEEINTAIEYIRFLLSKMQLLKTKQLSRLAREMFNPGGARKTNISAFSRPKKGMHRRKK